MAGTIMLHIPDKAFRELWQQIRGSGFVAGTELPYGLDARSSQIIPLMVKLPYIELVAMDRPYSAMAESTIGLRIALRPHPVKPTRRRWQSQLPLLASAGGVEP